MNEPDFLKRLEKYVAIAGKYEIEKHFIAEIEPFLSSVSDELSKKYIGEKLYPHVSNFKTHILFRLGLDKKMTHRASVSVSFGDDYIVTGFDLTHALKDAALLRKMLQENADKIAKAILKLKDYSIWIPNAGITENTPVENIDPDHFKKVLLKYNPKAMRDCYFKIRRPYSSPTMTKEQLVELFTNERKTFAFLLDDIKNRLH